MFGDHSNSQARRSTYDYVVKPNLDLVTDGSLGIINVVIPISMNNPSHRGESLKALIGYYRSLNPTILVADALQRHNYPEDTEPELKAAKLGDQFLANESETLGSLTVLRWNQWKIEHHDKLEVNIKLIEKYCQQSSSLYNACLKVWQSTKTGSQNAFECSLNYQKEEYAVILSMSEIYSHLVYPRDKTPAISRLYGLFSSSLKMPKWVFAHIKKQPIEQSKIDTLPVAYRVVSSSFLELMRSEEVSPSIKLALMEICLEQMSKQPEFTQVLQNGEYLSGSLETIAEPFGEGSPLVKQNISVTFFGKPIEVALKEQSTITPIADKTSAFR